MVWKLGWTSMLTDISTEMVKSMLPLYLVLHLHLNPLQYGAIDGTYNGIAVALLSLAAGVAADRTRRYKEMAAAGYGLSALCKLLLMAAGGAWGAILAVAAMDRLGKGIRTAPRDALISLHSSGRSLAGAFALHRALDAGGALLGPVLGFLLISRLPGAFDAVWVASFVFALLGWAVIWLFVHNPSYAYRRPTTPPVRLVMARLMAGGFRRLTAAGVLLSLATVGDGFLYLLLQQRGSLDGTSLPLFYVMAAGGTMLFSVPVGRIADRWGRRRVLLAGYGVMGAIYLALFSASRLSLPGQATCLLLLGFYGAATDGVLAALASSAIPSELRTTGLATLATVVGLGKFLSALAFGWLWQARGAQTALAGFAAALAAAILVSALLLRENPDGPAR